MDLSRTCAGFFRGILDIDRQDPRMYRLAVSSRFSWIAQLISTLTGSELLWYCKRQKLGSGLVMRLLGSMELEPYNNAPNLHVVWPAIKQLEIHAAL